MATYQGQCHCGAIGFMFQTDLRPSIWSVRACQCSFCRAHAAACTSDPAGRAAFDFARESALQRYQFGRHTADYLICRTCGVYIGAVLAGADGEFATLNTRAIASVQRLISAPVAVDYADESMELRRARRRAKWTPVVRHL